MAINKTKNTNLQITISKDDLKRIEEIQDHFLNNYGIELTKSKAIALVIRRFNAEMQQSEKPQAKQPNKTPRTTAKPNGNYQALVIALKDKLGVSYPRLSQIIGIPSSTLKKYGLGQQTPSGENLELLKEALNKYGIK